MTDTPTDAPLRETPLAALHRRLGARMVPFAGWSMPVQYPTGILAEHTWTRGSAGLFDVSHMGQAFLAGPDHVTTAAALEALTPGDIRDLAPGRQRYTLLLTSDGGIVDDLMVTRPADPAADGRLMLVVNASRREVDFALIEARLPPGVSLERADDRGLLALQGPKAAEVVGRHAPQAATLRFMEAATMTIAGVPCHVSRSGYTGEDGFEISAPSDATERLAEALLREPEVKPIGLGARDSLRLEAGLPLYGHDIDETTTPVEAALTFAVAKRRRTEGHFPGATRIIKEIATGPARRRVGLRLDGRAPAREGAEIMQDGRAVGTVTSGGFGPTAAGPIAMGYVAAEAAEPGTRLDVVVRGRPLAARVVPLPFVPHRYARGPGAKP